jgi:arginyl-tRNA synthetase
MKSMSHPLEQTADFLTQAYKQVFNAEPGLDIKTSLEYCDPQFGDFASNIAMQSAKTLKTNPKEIAKKLAAELSQQKKVESVEVAGAGFLNIRLQNQVWSEYFDGISREFGSSQQPKPESIQLEFISANPTGPLVLTNAWAGYYGDILANIYASQGYDVAREYYLNDGGNQIVSLGKAVKQALGESYDEETAKELYRGEYIDKVAESMVEEYGTKPRVIEAPDARIGKQASEIILERFIKADLGRLGVHFDTIFSETIPDTKEALARLEKAGLLKTEEGATWLNGEKVGLDKDEVLIRSYDKGETYFLKDIAYQLNRLEQRKFDWTVTIWGPDHHGQAIRLQKTLEALGHSNFAQLHTQTIRLIKDGQEFKMSKRRGNYILLDDFLNEVPSEAARFYFGLRDTNSHMDFDIDLVRERSSKNPVYYALYAYARACSIEAMAEKDNTSSAKNLDPKSITPPQRELMRQISKIPLQLVAATSHHKVHLLLHEVLDTARCFHDWYEKEKAVGQPDAAHKLRFIVQFKQAYEAVFSVIGVTLVEKM